MPTDRFGRDLPTADEWAAMTPEQRRELSLSLVVRDSAQLPPGYLEEVREPGDPVEASRVDQGA